MRLLEKLKQQAVQIKSEIQVLFLAYTDKRTPVTAKILIGLTLGYSFSPIDLIPDFIPILGYVDDLIIVPILIKFSIKLIPTALLIEIRKKVINEPGKFKKNNWIFAFLIVVIWLLLFYLSWKHFRHMW